MKILFLNNFNYIRGGAERVLFEEMRMLKEAGHDVAIFSRTNTNNEPSVYEKYFPDEINTERFSFSPKAFSTLKELIYSIPARNGLQRVIDEFHPDIAHAHNIYGRLSLSVLDILKEKQIPIVLTLHDYKFLCPNYLMFNHGIICEKCKGKRFYRAILTKCHKNSYVASTVYAVETWLNYSLKKYDSVKYFISSSRFVRDKAMEFGWDGTKIIHIPNLIDKERIKPSSEVGNYILYLGRLSHEKGIKTLLNAFSRLRSGTSLKVVGDGPMRDELQRIVKTNSLPVSFTGHLAGERLEEMVSNAKVVVIPSEWYENAPLSLLESFAYGKPVIGAKIGGIPELIDNEINGYTFEPGNVQDLAYKLELILGLPDKTIRDMGRAAREKAETIYSAEAHYDKLMHVYHKAVRGNPSETNLC